MALEQHIKNMTGKNLVKLALKLPICTRTIRTPGRCGVFASLFTSVESVALLNATITDDKSDVNSDWCYRNNRTISIKLPEILSATMMHHDADKTCHGCHGDTRHLEK